MTRAWNGAKLAALMCPLLYRFLIIQEIRFPVLLSPQGVDWNRNLWPINLFTQWPIAWLTNLTQILNAKTAHLTQTACHIPLCFVDAHHVCLWQVLKLLVLGKLACLLCRERDKPNGHTCLWAKGLWLWSPALREGKEVCVCPWRMTQL